MKKLIAIIMIFTVLCVPSCIVTSYQGINELSGISSKVDITANDTSKVSVPEDKDYTYPELSGDGIYYAEIDIEEYGKISLVLDANVAPITVANFVKLAKEGFYDGLTFHRVYKSFMIQGGDPEGNGMGGSDENIKGEFSANGIANNISHVRGVISMARSQAYDSASSQFFIVHEDSTFLDGEYAGFGYVTDGIEVVDSICANTPVIDSNGTVKDGYQPKIKTVKIVEVTE